MAYKCVRLWEPGVPMVMCVQSLPWHGSRINARQGFAGDSAVHGVRHFLSNASQMLDE